MGGIAGRMMKGEERQKEEKGERWPSVHTNRLLSFFYPWPSQWGKNSFLVDTQVELTDKERQKKKYDMEGKERESKQTV